MHGICAAIVAPLIGAQASGSSCFASVAVLSTDDAQLFYTSDPYQWLFLMGAIVMLMCGLLTIFNAHEKSTLYDSPVRANLQNEVLFVHMWSGLVDMPRPLLRVLAAFFFSWCAFSPFLILDALWFGRNVFAGTVDGYGPITNKDAFTDGVHMSLYNSAVFSAVTLLFSLVLPMLVTALSVKVNPSPAADVCHV